MRTVVIGDIHGCAKALRTLLEEISPNSDDKLIFLGDYIDRGPDSQDVVEQIIRLREQNACCVVTLRGNHEVMLQGVVMHAMDDRTWLTNGGNTTVASYGGSLSRIPESHMDFYRGLLPHYELEKSIFVHANYDAALPMDQQHDHFLYWTHLSTLMPGPHCSSKRVYVGHTPQASGNVWDLGYLVCLDTYCFGGGYLTAYQTETSEVFQVDRHGHLRRPPLASLRQRIKALKPKRMPWRKKPSVK